MGPEESLDSVVARRIGRLPHLGINCNVEVTIRSARTRRVLRKIHTRNRFLLSGRRQVRDLLMYPDLNGDGFTPKYIAIGSSGASTTDAMVGLENEVLRKLITVRLPLDSGFRLQLYVDPAEANGTTGAQDLREVALFTAGTGGEAWARATHPLVSKSVAISVTYDWTFTLSTT